MLKRSEIDEKYKWDLSKYFKSDEEFYEELENLSKQVERFKTFEGKLKSDDILFEYLEFKTEIYNRVGKLSYAYLRQCEDLSQRSANDMLEKQSIVVTKLSTAITAVEVEIDKFSIKRLKDLQNNPKFKNYKRYFELTIRHKKHSLSKNEELLLSKMGEFTGGFSDNFDKFSDADLKFDNIKDSNGKDHEFNQSNYTVFAESTDRTLRENAFKEINGKRGEFINFLASNYINDVKETCVFAKIRKYKSALKQAIFCEEASEKVYNLLIKKVRENVGILQEYFEIKRKMLGLKQIAIFDTFAPVSHTLTKKYTYDEAIELVKEAVKPLGEDYVKLIQKAKDERWIDVFPNKNKRSGAFCSSTVGATPVVLTNFEGNLESVFTLAHELGHAMHSYYSDKFQPVQTCDYVIFVAEVASTVNEMLLLNLLLKKATSDEQKIYLYDYFFKEVRGCIFRQTMFAEFEQFAHEEYEKENPLSADLLCDKYEQLNNFYHGKKVKQIPQMRYEWARIPHFYDSFYVYKYATGLICAINIANMLLSDNNAKDKYLAFLSAGCSKDPISLLKDCGCDLEKENIYNNVFDLCSNYLNEWEHLIK